MSTVLRHVLCPGPGALFFIIVIINLTCGGIIHKNTPDVDDVNKPLETGDYGNLPLGEHLSVKKAGPKAHNMIAATQSDVERELKEAENSHSSINEAELERFIREEELKQLEDLKNDQEKKKEKEIVKSGTTSQQQQQQQQQQSETRKISKEKLNRVRRSLVSHAKEGGMMFTNFHNENHSRKKRDINFLDDPDEAAEWQNYFASIGDNYQSIPDEIKYPRDDAFYTELIDNNNNGNGAENGEEAEEAEEEAEANNPFVLNENKRNLIRNVDYEGNNEEDEEEAAAAAAAAAGNDNFGNVQFIPENLIYLNENGDEITDEEEAPWIGYQQQAIKKQEDYNKKMLEDAWETWFLEKETENVIEKLKEQMEVNSVRREVSRIKRLSMLLGR